MQPPAIHDPRACAHSRALSASRSAHARTVASRSAGETAHPRTVPAARIPLRIARLSCSIRVSVRLRNTVSNFELTFLVSGAGSQTLVVALFYEVFAGGVRSVDALALMRGS